MNLEKLKTEGALKSLREQFLNALKLAEEACKYSRYKDALPHLADAQEIITEHNRLYDESVKNAILT